MKPLNTDIELRPYNKAVRKAFNQILEVTKVMLAGIEHEELRYTLSRQIKPASRNILVHEFINPLIYLSLQCGNDERFAIHYGFEKANAHEQLSNLTACFTRAVYQLTCKSVTQIDIEDCVQNDWCITECSALYEHMEERNMHHQFSLIKYKPATRDAKTMMAVA